MSAPQAPESILTTHDIFAITAAVIFASAVYLFDSISKSNKKLAWLCVLFPPIYFYACYKYREKLMTPIIYISVFTVFISFLGLMTRENYASQLWQLFIWVSLWQFKICMFLYSIAQEYILL